MDNKEYATDDISELDHERWQAELDIRAIKATLHMEELRCKTPFMVEKELWAHLLAYNLIRKVACQAAQLRGVWPRTISFAATRQLVLGSWSKLTESSADQRAKLVRQGLRALGKEKVGDGCSSCSSSLM